nr:MAG TPA: chromosome segregation protein [Caudoviricetes sp.]
MKNKILIRTSDRKTLHKDRRTLGMNGENLQEVLLFCLDEKIEGTGIVEVELPDETKGMIEVERNEEGYELPIKSSLLSKTGFVKFQLRILHDNEEIFKSEIIPLEVKDSINATETIPEQYPTWIDTLTDLKKDLEKAESERVSNESERISAEKTRQENFTKMQKKSEEAVSNIKDLTDKYNENDKQKTEAFNKNFEEKQKAINDNAEAKTTAFGENAEAQTKTFNTNSDDKLAEYNRNHTAKMKEFDDNYDIKTKKFDDNAAAKLEAYNKNDKTKTDAYNKNTELKEKSFNDNAGTKTETFNTNAADKQNEFDENASDKLAEYNQNAKELINKVEQVQAENETLKAENKLIKEQIPSANASGNSIHVKDSGTLDFDWKINGGNGQKTREGYNSAKLSDLDKMSLNGIEISIADEILSVNGTSTAGINRKITPLEITLNANMDYTFVAINDGTNSHPNDSSILIYKSDFSMLGGVKIGAGINIYNITPEEDIVIKEMHLYIGGAGIIISGNIKVMLLKGNYTADTIPAYEQYGAMPSLGFSSEIETVGNNVNEFNCRDTYTSKGITLTKYIDGSFKVEGISTENFDFNFNIATYFKIKGKNAFKYEVLEGNSPAVWFWNSTDSNSNITLSKTNNSTVVTFEDEKELTLNFTVVKGTTYSFTARMKIVKGKETGLYSPYRNG